MKRQLVTLSATLMATVFSACRPGVENGQGRQNSPSDTLKYIAASDTLYNFIPADTANKMLGSYLNSINYTHNDSDIQSLTIDVKQLRRYIDSMPNSGEITSLKLMFAHTQAFSNSPGANTFVGYRSNKLTIIIAAYNAAGNYVLYNGNRVLDRTEPCPPICPPGNAGQPFLIW